MTTIEITPQLKVTMLKHLVAGHDLDFVATATRVPRERVLDIVSTHGYPDHDRMAWAVDVLIAGGDKIPERQAASSHRPKVLLDEPTTTIRSDQSTVHRPAPRNPGFAVIPPPTARPVHTSTAQLLHQAGESEFARTRGLGAKISALIADLTSRLDDEQGAHEAKVKADKEAAAVAARIAVLEAEIAKLKGRQTRRTKTGNIPSTTGQIPSSRPRVKGDFPCINPGCDRTFDTGQGLALHRRRAHEGFNPNAAGAA